MSDLLIRYAPAVAAWVLLLGLWPGDSPTRRSVRWVLFGLAISLTTQIPAVYAAAGELVGVGHIARLVGHGSMLLVAWAAQALLARVSGVRPPGRWHVWWPTGAFVVMCVLFSQVPHLLPQAPGVLEYCVVYLAGMAPALGNVMRLGVRYAVSSGDPAIVVSMALVVTGTVEATLYLVNKAMRSAESRFSFDYPLGHTTAVSVVLPVSAYLLVLAGAAYPALVGWLGRYRTYRQLGPLWRALYRADPAIALDPPTVPDPLVVWGLRLRLYRRVIEIRDGLLSLRPYRAAAAGEESGAAVEAATIAAALHAKAAGLPPKDVDTAPPGGTDLAGDTRFLVEVSRCYRDNAPRHGQGSATVKSG